MDPPAALARHEAYRLVLTVHMAALAAVLAHARSTQAPADPVEVSGLLLARERDHWVAMHASTRENPLATSPDAMGQVVYTATLTGPLSHTDGKKAVELAGVDSREAAGQLLKDHAVCYPPTGRADPGREGQNGGTVLEPLYPDRLAEDFIALTTPGHTHDVPADPWADGAPARLLTTPLTDTTTASRGRPGDQSGAPVWARHAVITLIEAAGRWPHLAQGQLYPLLAARPRLALHAGGAALAALAGMDGLDPALLKMIEAQLPAHRHIDLDIGIAALATRLAQHRLASTTDPATRARTHGDLAVRLSYAGLHSRALTTGHQATQTWRQLMQVNRDAYLPDLAGSLNNHALRLAEVGRWAEAVLVSQEAVELRRELVAVNRDAYLPGYTQSVTVLGYVLVEDSRFGEAIAPLVEAFVSGQELPEYAQDIVGTIVDLLRHAYAGDASEVAVEFRAITGQDIPDWMKEPPTAPED